MRGTKYILNICFLILSQFALSQTAILSDPGFKACMLEKHPDLLDANQNLIISAANTYSGYISCIGYNILNPDGLQYFSNATDVNLSQNLISQINAFPISSSLTRLVLDDNQLSTLPDLSNLPNLKTLTVRRNKLMSLPDISANKKITQLYVQSNQLTFIPDLRNQKELWAINFSGNRLTLLPFLDSLAKLTELVVADNQLTQIQPLDKLSNLKLLNISGNKIAKLPNFAPSNLLEEINLKNNIFTQLPNFTVFPNLKSANLNDNYFTFEDLLPLKSINGYSTIFPLTSQKNIEEGQTYNVSEKEDFYIKTNTDLSVSDVKYTWYFEDKLIQTSTKNSLKVFADSTGDSGYYYCELSNASFPDLILKTSNFYIQIEPCFNNQSFIIEVSPRTCQNNGGKISVSTSSPLPANFVYELKAVFSTNNITSTYGDFMNLGDKEYFLYGNVKNCKKQIGAKILINDQECENVFITADGDGVDDVYFFNEQGFVAISDKFGNEVSSLQIPAKWDGSGKNGLVPPGLYFANINKGKRLIKITVVH